MSTEIADATVDYLRESCEARNQRLTAARREAETQPLEAVELEGNDQITDEMIFACCVGGVFGVWALVALIGFLLSLLA